MEIITQNYEKLLEEMIINKFSDVINIKNNPNENKVFNYIKILDTLDERICDIAKESLTTIIESIDRGYRNSFERMHRYHIKAKYSRSIMTIFGQITYRKTVYTNKYTDKSFCYVDDYFGLKKNDYFDPYIKALIINYAADNPCTKVAKIINDMIGNRIKIKEAFQYITKQTIRNVILLSNISKPQIIQKETPEDLYIMADEKFIATQNNDHKDVMVKQIVTFDGRDIDKSRTKLLNKQIFTSFDKNPVDECLDYLYYTYNMDNIKNIYVMGDGAKWIKSLVYEFKVNDKTNVSFNLDKFHFKQSIHHIGLNKNIEDILTYYVLNNEKKNFIECCDCILKDAPHREETINKNKEYIINNWRNINNLYINNLKCPMESQISHNLASLFSSRPKAYSKRILTILVKLRTLYNNSNNLKLLYLNNYNKKETLIFNKESLYFSVFEPYNNYQINESIIPTYYNKNYDNSVHLCDLKQYIHI